MPLQPELWLLSEPTGSSKCIIINLIIVGSDVEEKWLIFAVPFYRGDDRIIRASRHYERAGQILTRLSVATARQFISGTPCELPAIGQRITVTAPIRVDFSGAWSDTPPQAYEWGGAVITVALTINKEVTNDNQLYSFQVTVLFIPQYPIKVIVERIAE